MVDGIEKAGLVATGDCVFGSLFLNVFGKRHTP